MGSTSPPDLLYFTERGTGSPLLLVHGLMVTGEMFEPIVAPLAQRHRLIVPDLRGCGKSRELPPPYTVKRQAADLACLLDHLGIEASDVLGYSQGGTVAQQLALDYPKRVNRLILSNTYAYNLATMREKIEGKGVPFLIRLLGMRRFAQFVVSQGLKQVPAQRAEWVVNLIAAQDPALMIAVWKAAMAFDSRRRLGTMKCPTLIIAGAKDEGVPMHHAKMLQDGIAGSTLAVIENADHALIWACPNELLGAVDKFLEE
jgi:pimeloyl-ACP methyl ester carboxylesterase